MIQFAVMLKNQLTWGKFAQNLIDRIQGDRLLVGVPIFVFRPRIAPGDKQHIWRGLYAHKTLSIVSIATKEQPEYPGQFNFKAGQRNFGCGFAPDMPGVMSFDLKFFDKDCRMITHTFKTSCGNIGTGMHQHGLVQE